MKNLACLVLCAFMSFGLTSCNKSDGDDNGEKVIPYRVHESVMAEDGVERSKSIYFYDSKDRLIRVQIQMKTGGVWLNDSEISYAYSGSKITETKVGAYVHTYILKKGKVISFEMSESTDDELALYTYDAAGKLIAFTEDNTPYKVSYDSYDRFSSFMASFSALGETISLVGTAVYLDSKISSLSVVKSISNKSTLNSKYDYIYSSGLLMRESAFDLDEETDILESVPTVSDYLYDVNNCLTSFVVSKDGVIELKYSYLYEVGEGNVVTFEYSPSRMLLKKWTGGMIK